MFLTYLFLTHFGCVFECISFVRTFVGTYVHFSSSNNMGKNEGVDQFPFDQRWAGEHMFSTPSGGYRNNGIILLNVAFFLGKWWITSRDKRKGMGGTKMDKREKDRRNLDIRGRGKRKKEGWDPGREGEGINCHTCEYLPTHILQVSEQHET